MRCPICGSESELKQGTKLENSIHSLVFLCKCGFERVIGVIDVKREK
jgi:hypothetical protein